MPGKRVQFDQETWNALDLLARDSSDFLEPADEACAQDDATRERLPVFLHAIHFRTTDALKARTILEPDSPGG